MAETAKILSPKRIVLMPDAEAGCSLEESCPPDAFRAFRDKHPGHLALTYINCSAEVKALSDIIVTSSNAEAIINSLPPRPAHPVRPRPSSGRLSGAPDGRDMLLWPGTCVVHEQFSERELLRLKSRHPRAAISAHPECQEAILCHADHVGSTSAMLKFVTASKDSEFIIATEPHLIHQMKKAAPEKTLHSRARRRRHLFLRQLPVHGAEYPGEALSVHGQYGTAGGNSQYPAHRRQKAAGPHDGTLPAGGGQHRHTGTQTRL